MKKLLLLFSAALTMLFTGCMQFDDTRIWDAIDELEDLFKDLDDRVEDLEEACEKMNTNIEALQTLITALQSHDTITAITPIKQGDKVVGYTITFTKSEPITIYHGNDGKDGTNGTDGKDGQDGENGKDGKDGYTPTIGVAQEDGVYYWTLDGEWLLDDNGNKIKAVGTDGKDGADGEDGKDGANGEDGKDGENGTNGENGKDGEDGADGKDGITPQLEIRDGYWYISYDNGATWKELGKATGEDGKDGADGEDGKDGEDGTNGTDGQDGKDGDSLFQSVTWDEEYAYFTLADGTVIKIPLASDSEAEEGDLPPANEIWYTSTDGEVVTPYWEIDEEGNSVFGANIISNTYENGKGVITFDGDVTSVGYGAFCDCSSLTSITIPDSVTSIGDYAFLDCTNLAEFKGKFASKDGRCLIVDGVLNSFAPAGLTEYIIPDGISSIGDYAFVGCSNLVSITIPDSVSSIEDQAFDGCSSLASITIPEGVTSIGVFAFGNCTSLAEVYCKPTTPPTGNSYMFVYSDTNTNLKLIGCKIYVPTESVEAYKAAYGWSDYADYIEPYNFGGGEGNAGVKEVAAVSLWGMWVTIEDLYLTFGLVSSGEDAGHYDYPTDSWNYGFMILSSTEPINDEVPLGTYTYVDLEKINNGEVELKAGIFTHLAEAELHCLYTNANGETQRFNYTEGTMVVSEGKIELTVTLDNGEVHHVVYEGSLQTWGEGA